MAIMRDTCTKTSPSWERKGKNEIYETWGQPDFGFSSSSFSKHQKLKKTHFSAAALIAMRMNQPLILIAWIKPLFFKWFLNKSVHKIIQRWSDTKRKFRKAKRKIGGTMIMMFLRIAKRDTPHLIVPDILCFFGLKCEQAKEIEEECLGIYVKSTNFQFRGGLRFISKPEKRQSISGNYFRNALKFVLGDRLDS